MAAADAFRFDHSRHRAAAKLHPEHYADFMRLVKDLRFGSRFQLLLAECYDEGYRAELIGQLDAVLAEDGLRSTRLDLTRENPADFAALESRLGALAADYAVIHLCGGDPWFDAARWEAFNIRREALAQSAPVRLVLWLTPEAVRQLAQRATDLWAWRSGVFSFLAEPQPALPAEPFQFAQPFDTRSLAQRGRRIAELRQYLRAEPPLPDDMRLPLLDELAQLLFSLGETEEALRIREVEELPLYRKLGDVLGEAIVQIKIADILYARSQQDDALRIYQEEVLPVFRRLGDERSVAVCQSKIADILQDRGQLDEALRICQKEVLPVYRTLGDVCSEAVCQGQIADILHARGQWDEALRIHQEDVLPVYRKLGDVRLEAICQGKIASILLARGQWGEALRIRQENELPVYRMLGDVRELAVCQTNIAGIFQRRGQWDEALRIYQEEALPALRRLGAVHELALVRQRIEDLKARLEQP